MPNKSLLDIQAEQARSSNNNNNRNHRRGPDVSRLPLEQGVIATLKESFGFIKGADRTEDVFFHYGELQGGLKPEDLKTGDEVEFHIDTTGNKTAAKALVRLEPGTILWETEDHPGERIRGIVERPVRPSYDSKRSGADGTIRILMQHEDEEHATADGPLVRFNLQDLDPLHKKVKLAHGDLVELTLVTERRSKFKYARRIELIMSEETRKRHEEDSKLLEEATEEHGVVTSLKDGFGFLKSNKRRQEVFFHYSNVELEDHHVDEEEQFVLREGQEMKFQVVEAGGKQRFSARKLKAQPRGSVKFHDHIATGITGIVTKPPQPQDAGHDLEEQGRIKLSQTIFDEQEDGSKLEVNEVFLFSRDSPGGHYSYKGGTAVGLWVEVGDILLFDIVRDVVDGAYRAAPTTYRQPKDNPLEVEEDPEDPRPRAVRLIALSPAMRAEGEINTLKDGFGKDAYGFLHFADRPVDVHFKFHQVLPDSIQDDLRLNMGIESKDKDGKPLKLKLGAQVQFDLSVHGTIAGHKGGKKQNHERENLKAQRILLLPPDSITKEKVIATGVKGKVIKEELGKPYSGTIELDRPAKSMRHEERHPLVTKLIDWCLNNKFTDKVVFRDIQSLQEDAVHKHLIDCHGQGKLSWSHVELPGETNYPGLFCITRETDGTVKDNDTESRAATDESDDQAQGSGDETKSSDGPNKQKRKGKRPSSTPKPVRQLHFDKQSIIAAQQSEEPPSVGDIVICDVVQDRRTGQSVAKNLKILERQENEAEPEQTEGIGVVKEIVQSRKFGFISVVDEAASKKELLFFHLTKIKGDKKLSKGDEVKFSIGVEKNGKRVALDIELLPKGTIPSKADDNACNGIVLLEPSYTSFKDSSIKHSNSKVSASSDSGSRWSGVQETLKDQAVEPETVLGCILLTEDKTNMFGKENEETQLRYNAGALATHGVGSSSATDDKSNPKRGDLVSFVKAKKGKGVRDIRLVDRLAADLVRGNLTNIERPDDGDGVGTAVFVTATDEEKKYEIGLDAVVSCDPMVLKENEAVEGIIYDDKVYGVCRTTDLYLESKLGAGHKQRPKLNLTVKKDRGGKILAQTMMAKGPDKTYGFPLGWTSRLSKYTSTDPEPELSSDDVVELTPEETVEDAVDAGKLTE